MSDLFDSYTPPAPQSKGASIGDQLKAKGQAPPVVSGKGDLFDSYTPPPPPPPNRFSKPTSYLDMAIQNSPSGADPQNAGNPNLNAIPEGARKDVNGDMAATALATTPVDLVGAALGWMGLGGKAAEATPAVQKAGTGILDQYGNEIFHDVPIEVKKAASNILQHPLVQSVIRRVVGEELGRHVGEKVAGHTGGQIGSVLGATLTGGH